jgi:hypothetical protein
MSGEAFTPDSKWTDFGTAHPSVCRRRQSVFGRGLNDDFAARAFQHAKPSGRH